ncbi:penicillin-binding protein activator [Methylohalobius crimeensis]|uniref:penicillin-binding protein activator n=1 Tax=Methylohalobius crimeensis TaxID=244365 RepID=UPI0003B72E6D|nr:penicillin-binding protein activator [Methylohalobius crimeensis]
MPATIQVRWLQGSFTVFLLLLAACAPLQRPSENLAAPLLRQAETLAAAGKHREAAQYYLSAADRQSGQERSHSLLRAAELSYRAGELKALEKRLRDLRPERMAAHDRNALALLRARLALDQDDPAGALDFIGEIDPDRLTESKLTSYRLLRARAFSLQGRLADAIRERVRLLPRLQSPQTVERNQQAILEALLLLPETELEQIQAKPHGDLAGWIELAQTLRAHPYHSPELDRALSRWRQVYPYHPADRARFLERHLAARLPSYRTPQSIALWLPGEGPFQSAADAVRSGILSARRLADSPYPSAANSEPVEFMEYDSTDTDPLDLYRRSTDEGAELIIGPLQKTELEQLASQAQFNPPVLALNALDHLTRSGLYQFALSPEEGVAQVADSAWQHDRRRALVLVPTTPFGERIATFFTAYWENLGGRVLEIQPYDPEANDFSPAIRGLLDLDESERRFKRLRQVVWEVKFEPRIRRDADFLFLQAKPRQGRLIRPQLLFYRAETLPVYATRDIYSGHPEPRWDRDLEGVRFCDIPWLLQGERTDTPSRERFETEWGIHSGAYLRLVALGMDAYRIPFRLLATGQRYAGATGVLELGNGGHIKRRLTCAEFRQGTPVIYGLAPEKTIDAIP